MKNNWTKTLLYVYKYLDRVSDGIDKLVEQNAFNSFYYGQNRSDNNVVSVAKRIINLCERKAKLVNMKVLVDTCLLKSTTLSAQLLIERYIDEDESDIIANRHNLHIRTYFRKLIQAETSFSILMLKEGFSEEKLSNYLSGEKWILEVYEKFKNEGKVDCEDKQLV